MLWNKIQWMNVFFLLKPGHGSFIVAPKTVDVAVWACIFFFHFLLPLSLSVCPTPSVGGDWCFYSAVFSGWCWPPWSSWSCKYNNNPYRVSLIGNYCLILSLETTHNVGWVTTKYMITVPVFCFHDITCWWKCHTCVHIRLWEMWGPGKSSSSSVPLLSHLQHGGMSSCNQFPFLDKPGDLFYL